MSQDELFVKWKYYHKNIHTVLETEANKEINFADVTIVSDDMIDYEVHKFVLSAGSPVLKEILLKNQNEHPTIYLNGVKNQELQYLLHSLAAQLPNYASLLHIEAKKHNSGIMSREKRIMFPSSNYVS